MKFTNKFITNLKPVDKTMKYFDGQGLILFVTPKGRKFWRYKYRFLGKENTYTIGNFPDISLSEAREIHRKAHKLVKQGFDPNAQKKKEKLEKKLSHANSFEIIARQFMQEQKNVSSKRYYDIVMRRLEQDVFPHIGNMPITEINGKILLAVGKKIEDRGVTSISKRQIQKCIQIINYAALNGHSVQFIPNNINGALKPHTVQHYAAIPVQDVVIFIQNLILREKNMTVCVRAAVWFMMLTFVRTSELIFARWDEIDFERKRWIIPAERMKMRKEHIVPLSTQAIELLERQRAFVKMNNPFIFPSPTIENKAISNNTILKVLKGMGYKGKMTGHGFRSLAIGIITEELKWSFHIADRQLAHSKRNNNNRAYDRAEFLDDRTKMMQDLGDYIEKIKIAQLG